MSTQMVPDLLDQLTKEFEGATLNRVAATIGETPAKTELALASLLPAILSGLASRAGTLTGANAVVDAIQRNNLASISLLDLSHASDINTLGNTGRSLVDFAVRGRGASVTEWVTRDAGIRRASAASLAGLGVSVALGFLGRSLGSARMNGWSLSGLLGTPLSHLENSPAGLVSALGLSGVTPIPRRLPDDADRYMRPPVYAYEKSTSIWSWLLPLLVVVALIGVFAYLFASREEVTDVIPQTSARTENPKPLTTFKPNVAPAPVVSEAPATIPVAELGAFVRTKLPNGINLSIPENGMESKLIAFIGDASRSANKETWFSFDRLEFETSSPTLKPSSIEQLSNISTILKAYPQVAVKIGGYTDNTGDADHNLKLSHDRATSTVNALVTLGIHKSRLAAEGYGEQYPVATNLTEEGRQRNRRIAIRVMKK